MCAYSNTFQPGKDGGWRRDICIKDSERIVVLVGGWLAGPLNRVG
jgi:hypothetical protein